MLTGTARARAPAHTARATRAPRVLYAPHIYTLNLRTCYNAMNESRVRSSLYEERRSPVYELDYRPTTAYYVCLSSLLGFRVCPPPRTGPTCHVRPLQLYGNP